MNCGRSQLGIIVIGRNEGERLRQCFKSLGNVVDSAVVYVDSNSTDESVAIARSKGIIVHELDVTHPCSAARARKEGADVLLRNNPHIKWIQFVDGDCVLERGWLDRALKTLRSDERIGIVCGSLSEVSPNASVYNRISDLQLRLPTGNVEACGGIFMIRRSAYEASGGFNPQLLTREERDLCERVWRAGYWIMRMEMPMARHDAGILHFKQWWKRAVWGGAGTARTLCVKRSPLSADDFRYIRRCLVWSFAIPVCALVGLVALPWSTYAVVVPALCALMYLLLFARLGWWRLLNGDSAGDAALYALFMIMRRFATGYGFMRYFIIGAHRNHTHRGSIAGYHDCPRTDLERVSDAALETRN